MPTGLLERYQEALQDEELQDQGASIAFIDILINSMLPDSATDNSEQAASLRKQILKALDSRRRHIETENRLWLAGQWAISIDQVMMLMSQILHIIQTTVIDPQQRMVIAEELQRLINKPLKNYWLIIEDYDVSDYLSTRCSCI